MKPPDPDGASVIAATKPEVIEALPLLREALADCRAARMTCGRQNVTLIIDVDVGALLASIALQRASAS